MNVPTCKLCGKAHWSYEDHYTLNSAINPDYIREMAQGALGGGVKVTTTQSYEPPVEVNKRTELLRKSVTKRRDETPNSDEKREEAAHVKNAVPKDGGAQPRLLGRPKKYANHAERQRAYRERKSG